MEIFLQMLNGDFGSAYTFIADKMNGMLNNILNAPGFNTLLGYFCTLGVIIAIVYWSMDLADLVATDNFTMEGLFKRLIKLIVCLCLMLNLKDLLLGMSNFTIALCDEIIENVTTTMSTMTTTDEFGILTKTIKLANSTDVASAHLLTGISIKLLPDVVNLLIGLYALFIIQLVCFFVSTKRTLKILWQVAILPVAIADFCKNNSTSSGMMAIKRILGLYLEAPIAIVLCIVVDTVTASPGALNLLASLVGVKLMRQYFMGLSDYGQRIAGSGAR